MSHLLVIFLYRRELLSDYGSSNTRSYESGSRHAFIGMQAPYSEMCCCLLRLVCKDARNDLGMAYRGLNHQSRALGYIILQHLYVSIN